ncbi:MAG: putative DNA-3-methyladenine glycosylase [Frankiales bacterium]|nr:putative DNA-3-methyladenine glycosylase [Frankiales bacterium]
MTDLVAGPDGALRCAWVTSAPEYLAYHDDEWGRQVRGDDALFERLSLEAFQSGLSWIVVLRKRAAFRQAFDGFDMRKISLYDDSDVARLLGDAGIVRNRAKITAVIRNAQLALELPDGLSEHLWSFAPAGSPAPSAPGPVRATSPESDSLAADLRRRGFRFVGPTTAYALMQATGMVNDHVVGCVAREAVGVP